MKIQKRGCSRRRPRHATFWGSRSYNGMLLRRPPHEWRGIEPWFWPAVARQLPPLKKKPFLRSRRKGGRPRSDDRLAFAAILWRLRCGGTWSRLPKKFGSSSTARRRLELWTRGPRLEYAWRAFLSQQSVAELERWRDAFAAGAWRADTRLLWRFCLERIWRLEFLPRLRPDG